METFAWMGRRGVTEAKSELLAMSSPEYWQACAFRVFKETPPGWPTGEEGLAFQACGAYMVVGDETIGRRKAEEIISNAKGDEQKDVLRKQLRNMLSGLEQSRERMDGWVR